MPAERISSGPPAVTVRMVAAEYGVEPKTVYAWIKKGDLRAVRLPGGDYRIKREHLDEFERCRDTSSRAPIIASGDGGRSGSSIGPTPLSS